MRGNGKFYLVLGAFCLIFSLSVDYEVLAFEKQNEPVSAAQKSSKPLEYGDQLDTLNRLKSVDQSSQSISEAKELSNLSILMEKALNSQPSAGQNNAYGNRYNK